MSDSVRRHIGLVWHLPRRCPVPAELAPAARSRRLGEVKQGDNFAEKGVECGVVTGHLFPLRIAGIGYPALGVPNKSVRFHTNETQPGDWGEGQITGRGALQRIGVGVELPRVQR